MIFDTLTLAALITALAVAIFLINTKSPTKCTKATQKKQHTSRV